MSGRILLLRLEAPLMSFGSVLVDKRGPTDRHPGTALITGLLANALGAYATVYYLTTGNFNILPIRIASMVSGDIFLDPNMASALAMVLVGLMTLITIVHQWLLRRSYHVAR